MSKALRTQRKLRRILRLLAVLIFGLMVLMLTACSYGTLFVVVNKSNQPIQVRYRAKKTFGDVRDGCSPPATMRVEELGAGQAWRNLSASDYQVDQLRGLMTLSLKPGEVLRIVVIKTGRKEDEAYLRQNFCLEEIELSGANGTIRLQDQQTYDGFKADSNDTRKLTYY